MYQQLRKYLSRLLDKNRLEQTEGFHASEIIPSNTLNTRLDLCFLQQNVRTDWALILLAAASGYISPDAILTYAIASLDEGSSEAEMTLAMEGLEANPNWFVVDGSIPSVAKAVSPSAWTIAFEKLFYAVVLWASIRWGEFENPSEALFTIWDDFGGIGVGRVLSLHDSWTDDCVTLEGRNEHMKSVCKLFLTKEKERLRQLDQS